MNPFQSPRSYEEFLYTLRERHPSIRSSTPILVRRGKRVAIVQGEITFAQGYRITARERISSDSGQVIIESCVVRQSTASERSGHREHISSSQACSS